MATGIICKQGKKLARTMLTELALEIFGEPNRLVCGRVSGHIV